MTLEEGALEVYEELSRKFYFFPNNCCKITAILMYSKGYPIVFGNIEVDNYYGQGKVFIKKDVYWNYDPITKTHFDITASQLNQHLSEEKKLPKIAIWKDGEETIYKEIKRGLTPYQVI